MEKTSASEKDGFNKKVELGMLKEGHNYIKELAKRLILKQSCISTAQYLFSKCKNLLSFILCVVSHF